MRNISDKTCRKIEAHV